VALEAAFLLAPAGEFAFVILATATAGGVVDARPTATIVTAIAGLSMLLTPFLRHRSAAPGRGLEARAAANGVQPESLEGLTDLEGHAVIAGMGRVGRAVARVLETEGVEILALDRNALRVKEVRKDGWRVYFGDASHPDILAKAGAANAALFVVTADDPDKACAMVARDPAKLRDDATIIARARDVEHAQQLRNAGATHVTPEAIEAGLQMAGRALEDFGLPPEAVRDRLAQERDDEYARIERES
jgi:CPA2 family monovalent cation:H+ antiporter-2